MKALLALALAACGAEPVEGEQVISNVVDHRAIPSFSTEKLDLLFVIDNSPAMATARDTLIADYRHMIDVLSRALFADLPDVHIGVVTTDIADQGRLREGRFLSDAPAFAWRRERNYEGALGDAFVELADVGTSGSSNVQPLEAAERALSPTVNPGFVRDGAALSIVVLTAGDDQGTMPVADVAQALKSLKGDPGKLHLSGAFGSCTGNGVVGADAPRLAALFDQFRNRNVRATLCDSDLGPLILTAFATAGGALCYTNIPAQHECAASLVDPKTGEEILLPECASPTSDRCWAFQPDVSDCFGSGQELVLRQHYFPFAFTLMIDCVADSP